MQLHDYQHAYASHSCEKNSFLRLLRLACNCSLNTVYQNDGERYIILDNNEGLYHQQLHLIALTMFLRDLTIYIHHLFFYQVRSQRTIHPVFGGKYQSQSFPYLKMEDQRSIFSNFLRHLQIDRFLFLVHHPYKLQLYDVVATRPHKGDQDF